MKRLLPVLVLSCALPGLAQDAPPKPDAAPAAQSAPAPAPAAPAASPVPSGEPNFTGFIDLGYRWVGTGGSFSTYRSVIDLGSGVKLLGTEFEILDPKHRAFDRIAVRAYNWGDDPYESVQVTVQKNKLYDFSADYRNIAYYNNLPGYADPLLATNGIILNEQSLDTRQHIGSYQLTLRPESWLVPYLVYERNSSSGSGIANFVSGNDEFPVGSIINNFTDNYRGGVRIEQPRFHITLEQGGTTFRDDQQLGLASGSKDYGNFLGSLLGQSLVLTSLDQNYRIRGTSVYTKGLLTANVGSWMDIYGQFLYSEPQSTVYYQQIDTGNQLLLSQLLFYTGEQSTVAALGKLPHTSGSFGAEIRPVRRLRIIPSWMTDRMHTTSSDFNPQTLTTLSGPLALSSSLSNALVNNYSQVEAQVIYELTRKITVRGGYRYVWGFASDAILPFAELVTVDHGYIRRNVGLAGIAYRPSSKVFLNADFEGGSSGQSYYRISLYNYERGRVRGRYQFTQSFSISGSATVLNNQNPNVGINYSFLQHQETLSLLYAPSGGKKWDVQTSYTRATLYSNINYLDPAYETPQRSLYRDNDHVMTAMFDGNIPFGHNRTIKISLGGSFFLSSGSNPTQFYQPVAKLSVPLKKNLAWVTEWRYYGFDENFYGYQAFGAEMVTTGVRLSR